MLRSIAVLGSGVGVGLLALAPVATAAPSDDATQTPAECAVNIEENSTTLPFDTCGPAELLNTVLPLAEVTQSLGLGVI